MHVRSRRTDTAVPESMPIAISRVLPPVIQAAFIEIARRNLCRKRSFDTGFRLLGKRKNNESISKFNVYFRNTIASLEGNSVRMHQDLLSLFFVHYVLATGDR